MGLNGSQAKIYLALISLGVADVKKISQTAGIDRGDVYRQIEILQKKTLVEKILNVPNEFKPMALGDGIRTLIQLKNKENDEIQQKARELLEKADHAETSWGKDQRISIIPSDEYHKLYGARAIDIAEKEILWYSQIERIPLVGTYYYEANKKALDRGIRYRSIAELSKPTNKILRFIEKYKKEFSGYEIRFAKPTLLVTFVLYDDKELNFSIENLPGVADSQILSTNNEQLIKVIKDYFELRWNSAMTEYPTKENNKTYNTKERS